MSWGGGRNNRKRRANQPGMPGAPGDSGVPGTRLPVLRLRTPSPERLRRRLAALKAKDDEHRAKLPTIVADLNELRNTRNKIAEREQMKHAMRFTELPTPVYNPPPKGMPRNSDAVQRVLDRRMLEKATVLEKASRCMRMDARLLHMCYDDPADVGVQAGGWGYGDNPDTADPSAPFGMAVGDGEHMSLDPSVDPASLGDGSGDSPFGDIGASLASVASSLFESVSLNDAWRFFRRTGGNGVEWSHQEALKRRKMLPNPFRRLVLAPWHAAGECSPTLDLTKWHADDEALLLAAHGNKRFLSLVLSRCEAVTPHAVSEALALRGPGLLQLDLSNGVRGCTELFRPRLPGSRPWDAATEKEEAPVFHSISEGAMTEPTHRTPRKKDKNKGKGRALDLGDLGLNGLGDAELAAAVVWAHLRQFAAKEGRLRVLELFREIDRDRNGSVDLNEFDAALNLMGVGYKGTTHSCCGGGGGGCCRENGSAFFSLHSP